MGRNGEVIIIRLSITPSANRNTYSVATLIIHIPRVEALHASTLGYEIATPTELLLLAGHNSSLMMRPQGLYIISLLSMMCAPTTMYVYPIVDGAHPWQLCRSCVSPAQGCGRSTLPWVSDLLILQL